MQTQMLAHALRQLLTDNQIAELYAIPGDYILPWLQAMEDAALITPSAIQQDTEDNVSFRLIQLSHEPSAVYAADAAARWRNAPAAVMLTYGAGALNGVNAIAQAYMEYVPLLVFAGYPSKQEVDSGLLLHHQVADLDTQHRILAEVTCGQCRLNDPANALQQLADIIQLAKRASQPVLIELPRDMATAPIIGNAAAANIAVDTVTRDNADRLKEQHRLQQCCQQLKLSVKHPCLLAGVKAKRFSFEQGVAQLVEHCGIPAFTTLLGRGVLDVNLPGYRGVFSGASADPALLLLRQADLLICAGVIRSDSNFAAHPELLSGRPVVWIDAQQSVLPDGSVIHLPAAQVLSALQTTLQPAKRPFADEVPALQPSVVSTSPCRDKLNQVDISGWRSDTLVARLHQLLSQQLQVYPFVVDVGDCLFAALSANPSKLLAPAFYASMGFAVPAALGVQLSSGLRPIVLVGDGAFQMTGLELGHCQRYGLNPIVIVLNNQSWGMIKAFAPDLAATGLGGWQYAALGRAMGCGASQIWNLHQLDGALSDALADTRRPRLIEVMLPQHSFSETLAGFSTAMCGSHRLPATESQLAK